jgi:Mce-associated membrane protein
MAVAVAVVLVAGTTALAGIEYHRNHDLTGQANDQHAVSATASALAGAILSYNAADLGAARTRVSQLSTASFIQNYDQNFAQALGGTITALQASASATVRDVYVADVTSTSAKAIVVVDFQTKSKTGNRQVLGTHLEMELVRQGGKWLVNVVNLLAISSETQTPVFGATTTTTSTTTTAAPHR